MHRPALPRLAIALALPIVLGAALLASPSSSVLLAQCDPGGGLGGAGVDLVVGAIPSATAWGNDAGFHGFSVGAAICNIGTAPAPWVANTVGHPVLLQSLYRYRDGRFEQIGASWLRHLSAALQQNLCGCGCAPGSLDALGVGCSDTTSSSLNGTASALATPSDLVDPAAGGFLWPPSPAPAAAGATARRIRVAEADLDPAQNPGASYFVEVRLFSAADSLAGNGGDGATFRPVQVGVTGSGYVLPFSGAAQIRRSALEAWADLDPAVALAAVPDGGGGMFLLASRVTDLGGGIFAYEYALANETSSRGARSFAVPLGGGTATSIGFHDTDPHSGDVLGGADWPAAAAGGELLWETATFAADPLGSALRAGRLDNFRFISDRPPAPATIRIGLFAPGSPAEVTVTALAPSGPADCNGNGIPDADEIATGQTPDCDGSGVPDECETPIFRRGDANGDAAVNIADVVTILGHLFLGVTPSCRAADDGNGDDALDIADPIALLGVLFGADPPLPAPWNACGADPDGTALDCCQPSCP